MISDCIFCKIVRGEIPCSAVYQDDHVLAFLDVNPWSPGHTLVIPKEHYDRLDQCPVSVISEVAGKLGVIANAVIKSVGADAYNVLNNNGRDSGQLVEHLHFHIIPRKQGDGIIRHAPQGQSTPDELSRLAEKIRQTI